MKKSQAVKAAMSQARGIVVDATSILERLALKDADLYCELTEPLLRNACYDALTKECRAERRIVWESPNYDPGQAGDRVSIHARSLLDFPLPGGKLLRDATKADLLAAAKFYAGQAADMVHKSRWFEAIASKLAGKKTVGTSFKEADLISLQEATA